ncbi:hypothetical protein CspHIS471_0310050 [Cutaneotrichosporon sp. HIS471]|nr:hypothetical protein CspHIS471_0310050 [Cutaneotrichosporon sp. HIS471]
MSKTPAKTLQSLTREEVAKHSKSGDLWIIIDTYVFDLSKFAQLHPGGPGVLLDDDVAGKDATTVFFALHRHEVLLKPQYQRLKIGQIKDEKPKIRTPKPDDLSRVPYAEPQWLQPAFKSPYYNDSHRRLQKAMRKFITEVVAPDAQMCEENGKRPSKHVLDAMAANGMNRMRMGPGEHLHGRNLMDGAVKGEEFDYFHELVVNQELALVGGRGYVDGCQGHMVIGLPPIMNYTKEPMRTKIIDEVLDGHKLMVLAITEAFAGSDVAGLRCTATKKEDGSGWVINGTKKWITGGTNADYFSVGARTGKHLTMFLVPRTGGVETKQIKTSYGQTAGTSYVTFDNVFVPNENMIGPENDGLRVILANFNHERFMISCQTVRYARKAVEECLLWASQREVNGKPLLAQPVIRQKIASMIHKTEAAQALLEATCYQMCNMGYKEQSKHLAGPIAFLKLNSTKILAEVADEATMIFGGRGLTKTGMGRFIEQIGRTRKFDAILGGTEEVLADLGVRQAMKFMPADQRL